MNFWAPLFDSYSYHSIAVTHPAKFSPHCSVSFFSFISRNVSSLRPTHSDIFGIWATIYCLRPKTRRELLSVLLLVMLLLYSFLKGSSIDPYKSYHHLKIYIYIYAPLLLFLFFPFFNIYNIVHSLIPGGIIIIRIRIIKFVIINSCGDRVVCSILIGWHDRPLHRGRERMRKLINDHNSNDIVEKRSHLFWP